MRRSIPLSFLILALACGGGGEPASDAAPDTTAAVPAPPPADPVALIAEIRADIAELPALTLSDPVAARRRAVDLYATKLETVEGIWRPRGSATPSEAAGQRVLEAETSFHELLALLNREAAPDSAAVAAAVADLDARLQVVLDTAGATP